MQVPSRATPLP